MKELLFRNVTLYDGSGNVPFPADVGIKGDKIIAVEKAGTLASGSGEVIEGNGLALTPGFVDVHTHSDKSIFSVPFCDSFLTQGVTTDISGNCGFSGYLSGPEPMTFTEFVQKIEALQPAINMAHLCGHNDLRIQAMGFEDRPPTQEELNKMKTLLSEALEQGAAGFSSGLFYLPGKFASTEEVKELSSLLKGSGKPYSTHLRCEGEFLLESVEEAIEIAKAGDHNLQISHLKTSGPAYWDKMDSVLKKIEDACCSGMDLLCDRYAYIHSGTTLRVVLPEPFDKVDTHTLCTHLKESESYRKELIRVLQEKGAKRDLERALLMYSPKAEHRPYFGKSVMQIACERSLSKEEALVWILASGISPNTAFGTMCEENLHKVLSKPYVITGSDGFVCSLDNPGTHPRSFGNFPNFYRTAVQYVSPEQVIRRMTSLPARKFNLAGRGMVKEGFYADLILLDLEKFENKGSYAKPNTVTTGIKKVFVNGNLALYEGEILRTTPRSGRFLRVF